MLCIPLDDAGFFSGKVRVSFSRTMQEQIVVEIDAMSRACEGGLRTQNDKRISLKVVVHMYHTEDQEGAGGLEECLLGAGGEEMLQ